jgi:hypothetical protein
MLSMEAIVGDLTSRGYGAVLWEPDDKTIPRRPGNPLHDLAGTAEPSTPAATKTSGTGR